MQKIKLNKFDPSKPLTEDEFQALSEQHRIQVLEYLEEINQLKKIQPRLFYLPHKQQEIAHNDLSRFRWLFWGNRSGKTVWGAIEVCKMAEENTNVEIWCVSLDWGTSINIQQKEIFKWIDKNRIKYGNYTEQSGWTNNIIILDNGSQIQFKSADSGRSKFQGTSKNLIWFDEEPPLDVYKECLLRIMDCNGKIIGTMTPINGMTWIYDEIYVNNGKNGMSCYIASSTDNPYLPDGGVEAISKGLSKNEIEVRIHGRFLHNTGLIYGDIFKDQTPFVINLDKFSQSGEFRDMTKYCSIDPHTRKPTGVLFGALDREGVLWIYDEIYQEGTVDDTVSAIFDRTCGEYVFDKYIIDDSAQNRDIISGKTILNAYEQNGIYCELATKGANSVIQGINEIRSWLNINGDRPSIVIGRNCEHLRWEFNHYCWEDYKSFDMKGQKEKPRKKDDDLLDCLRYIIQSNPRFIEKDRSKQKKYEYKPSNSLTGY